MLVEQRGVVNTYDRDFEHLEVNEQDLNLLSDNDVNSANDSLEADATCTVEEEKNKKNSKSVASPQQVKNAPASRQKQSTSVGAIHRKFWIMNESFFVLLGGQVSASNKDQIIIYATVLFFKL